MSTRLDQQDEAKLARFLGSLSTESEFFGILGREHPNSFYKVYVRPTQRSRTWWKFETRAGPTDRDPVKFQAKLDVRKQAVAIWGPLKELGQFTFWNERPVIGRLFERARELATK